MTDEIKEGEAVIKTSKNVFYNPAQKFNRDLTILVINNYIQGKKNTKIFEAMSASGLRGIRYAKEIVDECEIHLNDMDIDATNSMRKNILDNDIMQVNEDEYSWGNKKIYISTENCNTAMYKNANTFDVIDIDPFGCCTRFVDAALATIKHDGLLCLTSTDTGVLCNNKQKCYVKYNATITKSPAHHEQSLRILLGYVCKAAGKFNRHIEPVLSVSVDFYIRLFIKVKKGKFLKSYEDISYYLYCSCFYMKEIMKDKKLKINECENCKETLKFCGPFYNKDIKDTNFVRLLMTKTTDNRIKGILQLIHDELDAFLFYSIPDLSHYLKTNCIPMNKIVSALLNSNYKVSLTHCELNSIKTNASITTLYDIIKLYFSKSKDQALDAIFKQNAQADLITNKTYFRCLKESKLGPLSRPKK